MSTFQFYTERFGNVITQLTSAFDEIMQHARIPVAMLFAIIALPMWIASILAKDADLTALSLLTALPAGLMWMWPAKGTSLTEKFYTVCAAWLLAELLGVYTISYALLGLWHVWPDDLSHRLTAFGSSLSLVVMNLVIIIIAVIVLKLHTKMNALDKQKH